MISVIAILAALAIPKFHFFLARARQTEVKAMAPAIGALEESYAADNGAYWPSDGSSPIFINNDQSTATSCIVPNPIGFGVADCRTLRYTITMIGTPPNAPWIKMIEAVPLNGSRRVFPWGSGGCPMDDIVYGVNGAGTYLDVNNAITNSACM